MVFSSTLFLFLFLPVTFLTYYVIPQKYLGTKNMLLLIASLFFYSWGEPVVVAVMMLSITVNFIFGRLMDKGETYNRKILLVGTVIFNVGLLFLYKYFNFMVDNINFLFKSNIASNIALPIGISFFTFQILSYTLDVYFGNVPAQKSFTKLALYIAFFPQLIAGPIVRYIDIEKQLTERNHNMLKMADGIQRFIIGLSKKVLIANQVSVYADIAFNMDNLAAPMAWIGALCYAVQIYFDFSGYSDMAIGLGKIFGFEFLENFDYPYISVSVQTFWRRWHISLSSWFRDYLYIPIGGNRKGKVRTYINLLIVFTVTGLWHGASWTFVVWGLYHGFFLIIERAGFGYILKKIPKAIGWLYTTLVYIFGWVIFRADTLSDAYIYIKSMFNFKTGSLTIATANLNLFIFAALTAGIIFSVPVLPYFKKKIFGYESPLEQSGGLMKEVISYGSIAVCTCLLMLSVLFLSGSDFNPFLYFRF